MIVLSIIASASFTLLRGNAMDLTHAVVISPKSSNATLSKALLVLGEEIERRTGVALPVKHQLPAAKQPVIIVGLNEDIKPFLGSEWNILQRIEAPDAEGFRMMTQSQPRPVVVLAGYDARGVLYAVGKFLRMANMKSGSLQIAENLAFSSTPCYPIRGHQLGYRPKTNAYDAWTAAQFDQYIRELAIFGANSIEIMPPRTDDDATSPHMKVPALQMMIDLSRIIDSYGMDVWIWYPNMGDDYTSEASLRFELAEREEIFSSLPRIDVVFVPGGDPGDLHPGILFNWLGRVAGVLHKYHPKAKIWISPQAFRPTKEWFDSFYANVNRHEPWFGGVVFGPWVKTPLPEIRRLVATDIPIRRYPDITHSLSCQYPVPEWDLAFAMTLGRECINPRPVAEKHIHNAFRQYANGSISYSEGTNDDVNKFIWSAQDWNPETPAIETLREYGQFFIGEAFAEGVAQGLLALEKNLQGPILANQHIELTLRQWQALEQTASPDVLANFRFQMGLLRAYYDACVQRRLIYETGLEQEAMDILRAATPGTVLNAVDRAEKILALARSKPVAQDYRQRCDELAEALFQSIGAQLSVEKYAASEGRGDFMDYIDAPLNDAPWLSTQFNLIRQQKSEQAQFEAVKTLIARTDPGPGGFYDNFGSAGSLQRVAPGEGWATDPGGLLSPRVSFGVGLIGEEWVHTVTAKGFEGNATPLAWMNQVTTLYDTPLKITYDNLNPKMRYRLKVAYTGRFRSRMKLTAAPEFLIHDFIQTGRQPVYEFDIPQAATQTGILELIWTCGEGERGSQVSEIWLMPEK
ncbi:hypothetical protein JXJ21_26445 [candidate division KSB1 bacterium]|nr:hypothetical protein [candidate division KSB1 bacterium]